MQMPDLDRRQSGRTQQAVVGQCPGERLSRFATGDLIVECRANPLYDATPDLALDGHRVDHRAAILGHNEVEALGKSGPAVEANETRSLPNSLRTACVGGWVNDRPAREEPPR
jgi:hypothetical protein